MKKNGFTKIEVIIILIASFIVLIVATPVIFKIMNNAKKSTFSSKAKMLIYQIEYKRLEDAGFDPTILNANNLTDYGFSNDNYSSVTVEPINNMIYIMIEGDLVWNNLIACGTGKNMKVVHSKDKDLCKSQ